jgi:hypothetical protein
VARQTKSDEDEEVRQRFADRVLGMLEDGVYWGIAVVLVAGSIALLIAQFNIVGILAGIKEIVVLSVEAATLLDKGPDFSRAVVEIGVLGGVVLVLALAAFVLRERRRDTVDAGEGAAQEQGPGSG